VGTDDGHRLRGGDVVTGLEEERNVVEAELLSDDFRGCCLRKAPAHG